MRGSIAARIGAGSLAAACLWGCALGCGAPERAESPRPAGAGAPARNGPPEILEARLEPAEPTVLDAIELVLRVRDPDRDALEREIAWLRNGAEIARGEATRLPAEGLARGDRVAARVRVRDGRHEVEVETEPVTIADAAPRIVRLELLPERPDARDHLLAVAEATDPDGDPVDVRFAWYANGRRLADVSGPALPPGRLRRGDRVRVEAVPTDGLREGDPVRSPERTIANAPPEIVSEPAAAEARNGVYRYRVVAEDPDGDRPLRFELLEGPPGMDIDVVTGELRWRLPEKLPPGGRVPIAIAVHDGYGGSARQRFALELREAGEELPAAPAP